MAKVTIEVSVHVECAVCKDSLEVEYNARTETLDVSPCASCLKKARDDGYAVGYEDS